MAAIAGQKTFVSLYTEVSEAVFSGNLAGTNTVPSLTRIKQMVNDSVREICTNHDWWFMMKDFTFNTIVGTSSYAMDDTMSEVSGMYIPLNFIPLQYLTREQFYKTYPGGYTNYGNALPWLYIPGAPAVNGALQFDLFPAPNAIYAVKVLGKTRIADMTNDTDTPMPIPPEWQDVIVKYTVARVLAMLGDPRANNWQQMYEKREKDMWLHNEHMLDYVYGERQFYLERGASFMPNIDRAIWLG